MEEAKRRMTEATKEYNRMRYKDDDTYRQKIKTTMRERYVRKTTNCSICNRRKPKEDEVCLKCVIDNVKNLKKSPEFLNSIKEIQQTNI